MEPQWNHDGRAKSGRMNGRWKVLFGRWKGTEVVGYGVPDKKALAALKEAERKVRWHATRDH